MWVSPRSSEVRRAVKRLLAHSHPAYRWARRLSMFVRYGCGRPHEADFAGFRHFGRRSGLFLDIGANSGESVLSFRLFNATTPILSIEPNRYHEPDLRFLKRWVRRFDYRLWAAGDENGWATLYVPVYRKLPLTGEASFHREQALGNYWMHEQLGGNGGAKEGVRLREVPVEVKRLDDLRLKPAFIKMDVQGFEAKVVAGLHDTISASRPVLLIERSGCDAALLARLADLGYTAFLYVPARDAFAPWRDEPAQNLFFIPGHTSIPMTAPPPLEQLEVVG